ncbi:MAG: hypothetical protein V4568_05330 [Pseudomonadota bacterium]
MKSSHEASLKRGEAIPLAIALASAGIALSGQWFWISIYFGFFTLRDSLSGIAVFAGLIGYAAYLLQLWAGRKAKAVLRLTLLLALMYLVSQIVKGYFDTEEMASAIKVLLLVVSMALAAWTGLKWSEGTWSNFIRASIAACLIFTVSFPLIGWATRINVKPVFNLGFLKEQAGIPKNVLMLLLDEMSPELADPVVQAVSSNLKYVQNSTIEAAGRSTANVIPAMLTGKRFDEVMPCGSTTICSRNASLDFSQLRMANETIDIIGFQQPYCAIQGMRSCQQQITQEHSIVRVLYDLVCNNLLSISECSFFMKKAFSRNGKVEETTKINQAVAVNQRLTQAILLAPFWNKGGTLYAHLFTPHPLGVISSQSLAEEYKQNMDQAAELVKGMVVQLRQRFGDEFIIVVTSDHPLRVDWWCRGPIYGGPDCAKGLPENKGRVPFIIGSPKKFEPVNVTSNLGLLVDMP